MAEHSRAHGKPGEVVAGDGTADATVPALIELGVIGAPFGVRGWVKVRSHTEPPTQVFGKRRLDLLRHGSTTSYRIEATGKSGGQLTAKLAGVETRDAAAALRGAAIVVPRTDLPANAAGDYYRSDLIGCEVVDLAGVRLGVVRHFVETPAHALMVVVGAREFWVPAVPQHLRRVDLEARRVVVDWHDALET